MNTDEERAANRLRKLQGECDSTCTRQLTQPVRRAFFIFICVHLYSSLAISADPTPEQVFERRIVPIFKSPNPSSCVQCHLSGVDLKNYILPSSEKTFLSLRDQGLIDLKDPAASKILKLINMREDRRDGPNLIHENARKAEYEAFAEWIRACCADPKLRDAPGLAPDDLAKPERPVEVIRHARKDRLLESFERNIWSLRFRCMSCHIEGDPECEKRRKEHGDRVAWIKKDGAEATMNYLIRESKAVNAKEPLQSLLLLKPLMEVKHGGGKKMLPGDQGYKAFRAWLEDYAAIMGNRYSSGEDLPKPATDRLQFGTDIWLKLSEIPPEWGDKLVAVRVYAWDAGKRAWEDEPIAFSDRASWGQGKLWQHTLTLSAAKESRRAAAWKTGKPTLPPGKYLVRVDVDFNGKTQGDWKARMGPEEYAGQAEFEARWGDGYGRMTVVDARRVKK
jgi:hypothetical protein